MVGGTENDQLHGNDGDDLIGGQDGDDFIDGGVGGDALYGDAGDDRLFGAAGDDRLDGGVGFDTAVFSGARSGYTILVGDGFVTVAGPEGTDTLFGVERLEFADGAGAPSADAWAV
jgi:Ca2+-binding RTX toxin-like protein